MQSQLRKTRSPYDTPPTRRLGTTKFRGVRQRRGLGSPSSEFKTPAPTAYRVSGEHEASLALVYRGTAPQPS